MKAFELEDYIYEYVNPVESHEMDVKVKVLFGNGGFYHLDIKKAYKENGCLKLEAGHDGMIKP